jgi:hypothetical protein
MCSEVPEAHSLGFTKCPDLDAGPALNCRHFPPPVVTSTGKLSVAGAEQSVKDYRVSGARASRRLRRVQMARKKRPEGTRRPNGTGTHYLGKDGYWHGRVTVGVLDNGKPDRRHVQIRVKTNRRSLEKLQRLNANATRRGCARLAKCGRSGSVLGIG